MTSASIAEGLECATPETPPEVLQQRHYFGDETLLFEALHEVRALAQAAPEAQVESGVAFRVPVQYWIYRRDDGSGGPQAGDLQVWIDALNQAHRDSASPMRFYQKASVRVIHDSGLLDHNATSASLLTFQNKVPGAVNIHAVRSYKSGNQQASGVYLSATDSILVRWDSSPSTTPHEVGHYLDLDHTHNWNNRTPPRCFQEPVSRSVSFNRINICFRPRGPRCASTGDALCDTPADPQLSGLVSTNCTYTGGATDYRGATYSPDTGNIMSYSRKICRRDFSAGQIAVMTWNLILASNRPSEWMANPRNAFDDFEPDNRAQTARTLQLGETQVRTFHWDYQGGSTFTKEDVDWVRFTLTEALPVEIFTHEVQGQPRANTIVTLFDADLNFLGDNDDVAVDDGFSRLEEVLTPGTYYVRVTNKSAFPHPDSRGYYQLTVQRCQSCCFNADLSGVSVIDSATGPFNLGARAGTWTDSVPEDLVVEDVDLAFNARRPLAFGGPLPAMPSQLEAYLCDGADLSAEHGGTLVLGDADTSAGLRATLYIDAGSVVRLGSTGGAQVHPASRILVRAGGQLVLEGGALTVGSQARVVVEAGGLLELGSDSTLVVQDQGAVRIEAGGTFHVRRRAGIQLRGDAAVLDLRGRVELDAGTLFTFTYPNANSGYVRFELPSTSCPSTSAFSCFNVQAGTGSVMLFRGQGSSDKVLEVAAPLHPTPQLVHFGLNNGRAEITDKGEIQLSGGRLIAFDAQVDGGGDLGLAVEGRALTLLRRVTLDGAGIRTHYARRLGLTDVKVRNTGLGIWTQGAGVYLNRVLLADNVFGWLASDLQGDSVIRESEIRGSNQDTYGIYIDSAVSARLRLIRSDVTQHYTGLSAVDDVEVAVKCGRVGDNREGFYLGPGSRLDMSTESNNGNVDASNNGVTMTLEDATALYLRQGHNDLAASLPATPKVPALVVRGTVSPCNQLSINALGNNWNHGPFPSAILPANHRVTNVCGSKILFPDPFPRGPSSTCPPDPPLCPNPLTCPLALSEPDWPALQTEIETMVESLDQ